MLNICDRRCRPAPARRARGGVFALSVGLFFTIPLFTLILSRLIFEESMPRRAAFTDDPDAPFAVGFSAYLEVAGRLDLYRELALLPRCVHVCRAGAPS
jgi:hypothetical protein